MKVLLDADTGVDDAIGMLYLAHAQHQGLVDIVGTGTVGGNVHVDLSTRNTLKLWELAGLDIPVAKGANKPLLSPLHEASHVHGTDGLAATYLPPPGTKETGEHAVDQMLRLSHEHAGELTLLAFGPLTNLGIAFVRDPGLAQRVQRVVLMGGSTEAGNVTATAEANIANDPEAARMVFTSGAPITMVGLNVTHQTCLMDKDLELLRKINNERSQFVIRLIRFMMDAYVKFGYEPPICVLHDPLSAGVCLSPDIVKTKRLYVDVETQGRLTRGMTVVDSRLKAAGEPNVDVAVEVDAQRFVSEFMEALRWWVQEKGGQGP
ncbi:MAG: nucleoside hydrolase [Anaerolineae bacterium]|jgi:purine nucleosidase